jgi:hypothetical protein
VRGALFAAAIVLLVAPSAWGVSPAVSPGVSPALHLTPSVLTLKVDQPILLHNTVATATGTYEQRLDLDSTKIPALNGNWTNAKFYYANGTAIPAWIEGNATNTSTDTIVWLRLYNLGASSSETIRLRVYALTDFTLSAGGLMGEAPTLSGTYGKFDNGPKVFPQYDGFNGTTLDSALWTTSMASGAVAVSSGLTTASVQTGAATNGACGIVAKVQNISGAFVEELDAKSADTSRFGPMTENETGNLCAKSYTVLQNLDPSHSASATQYYVFSHSSAGNNYNTNTVAVPWSSTADYVWGLRQTANSSGAYTTLNYSHAKGGPFGNLTATTAYGGIFLKANSGTIGPVYWWRERVPPPANVMPTASYVPRAPTALNATALSSSTVSLTWVAAPGTTTNYTVWRWNATTCGGGPVHAYSEGVVTNATLSTLNASSSFSLEVVAFNATGQGDISACVTVTTLPPPWIGAAVVSGTLILGIFVGVGILALAALTAGSAARDRRRRRGRTLP